jgi:hypothetical protein
MLHLKDLDISYLWKILKNLDREEFELIFKEFTFLWDEIVGKHKDI